MTDRDVKRLSRVQILTLLRQQEEEITEQKETIVKQEKELAAQNEEISKLAVMNQELKRNQEEIAALKAKNEELTDKLESRKLLIEESGSLAEAALTVSGVIKAAQDAANIYLDNVKAMESQKMAAAEKIEADATRYAQTIRDNADRYCSELYKKTHLALREITDLFELQINRGTANLN